MGFAGSVSRRRFSYLLAAGGTIAALRPGSGLAAAARAPQPAAEPLRLHFNENPYGLSPSASRALDADLERLAWRYPGEERALLVDAIARHYGVNRDHIVVTNGSSEALHLVASARLSPRRSLVVADPTYEAMAEYAGALEAPVVRVPLDASYEHDVEKMVEASAGAGVVYICNPNNPTGSITSKEKLRRAIAEISRDAVILVDEAYAHYATSDAYESVIPMIDAHPNVVVARTFSKIYGMAGIRCGYAIAAPEMIAALRPFQSRNSMNAAALIAARASLGDEKWVDASRRRNAETRVWLTGELSRLGHRVIPSEANFIMVDLGEPIQRTAGALRERGILVGRPFPPYDNYLRVTIGKPQEMQRFVRAFAEVGKG